MNIRRLLKIGVNMWISITLSIPVSALAQDPDQMILPREVECIEKCGRALITASEYIDQLETAVELRDELIEEVIQQNKQLERDLKRSVVLPSREPWYKSPGITAVLGLFGGLLIGAHVAK